MMKLADRSLRDKIGDCAFDYAKTTEMKLLFFGCIEEVRQETKKRRLAEPLAPPSKPFEKEINEIEDLLQQDSPDEECIKGIIRSMPGWDFQISGNDPLMFSFLRKLPKLLDFALRCGLNVEQTDQMDYTLLFTLLDSNADTAKTKEEYIAALDTLTTLIVRGGGLQGEFRFNKETPFKLAAMKFYQVYYPHVLNGILGAISTPLEWMALIDEDDAFTHGILYKLPEIVCSQMPVGIIENGECEMFYTNRLKGHAYILMRCLEIIVTKKGHWENRENELKNFDFFFSLLRGKETQPQIYMLELIVQPTDTNWESEAEVEEALRQINQELLKGSTTIDTFKFFPPLYVAQYRGEHYYKKFFYANQRLLHVWSTHLNRVRPSPAVLAMQGLEVSQEQNSRESVSEEDAEELNRVLDVVSILAILTL